MYYFECPSCQNIHDCSFQSGSNEAIILNGPSPQRQCDGCGQDGCVDCLPDSLCQMCDPSGQDDRTGDPSCGCLACLNGWGHGGD